MENGYVNIVNTSLESLCSKAGCFMKHGLVQVKT